MNRMRETKAMRLGYDISGDQEQIDEDGIQSVIDVDNLEEA
jgi:hypothetical protein